MNRFHTALNHWDRHRVWIAALACTVLLLIAQPFAVRALRANVENETQTLLTQKTRLTRQLDQWNEDALTAADLAQTIQPQEVDRLLAVPDASEIAAQIETFAALARLDRFSYNFTSPQLWKGDDLLPTVRGIAHSTLSIEADAPHDGDALAFIRRVKQLTGKMTLRNLTLSRLKTKATTEELAAYNLHIKAEFDWLANAAGGEGL